MRKGIKACRYKRRVNNIERNAREGKKGQKNYKIERKQ